ncbi:MAG: hypothetical protein QOH79_1994 [Acidimicrobiaceae bacterium]
MSATETRDALQRVATHVLARARFAATGRFGLRATPGGFGTPAFGDGVEVLRVAGAVLVREREGRASTTPLDGATLAGLAAFAGVDLTAPFDAGKDAPALGDPDAPLPIDADAAAALADWWHLGWRVIDAVMADAADAMAMQLWPEHFDAGSSVAVGPGENDRCNLGASPGDAYSEEPYLYLGPWTDARPGDASYWNAPFGAVLRRSELAARADRYAAGVTFLRRGLELLSADRSA